MELHWSGVYQCSFYKRNQSRTMTVSNEWIWNNEQCVFLCVCVYTICVHRTQNTALTLITCHKSYCMSAFVQIPMHQWMCVCVLSMFLCRAWHSWVCFDRFQSLCSRSAHWRDGPPVNGCSGAWAVWHSFEFCTETHEGMNTHALLYSIIDAFITHVFLLLCEHGSLTM